MRLLISLFSCPFSEPPCAPSFFHGPSDLSPPLRQAVESVPITDPAFPNCRSPDRAAFLPASGNDTLPLSTQPPPGSVPSSAGISSMADAGAFDSPAPSEQLRSPRPVARGQEKPFDRTAHDGSKPLAPHPFSIVHAQRHFCGPCMKAAAKERRQQSPEKAEVTSVRGFFL